MGGCSRYPSPVSPVTPVPAVPGRRRVPPLLSRRRLTSAGSAAAVLLAAGCTEPDREEPTELPARPADPDEGLVADALAAERGLVASLEATGRRHPGLRDLLREPLRIHRAHVRLLARASDGSRGPSASGQGAAPRVPTRRVPARVEAAVVALTRAEGRLRDRHVETALRADSGVLARLLAGMAAAAAQQEVLVPRSALPVPPDPGQPA